MHPTAKNQKHMYYLCSKFSQTTMKQFYTILLILGLVFIAQSCNDTDPKASAEPKEEAKPAFTYTAVAEAPMTVGEVTLSRLEGSPAYAEASLSHGPLEVSETGEAAFNFTVTDYELGAQTANAGENNLANSGKGQHIHLIINNGPYSAHYEPGFNHQLNDGNNVILAFLSRSYHESVKNGKAFVVTQVSVGENNDKAADLKAPHLFYSRPKGTYKGAATNKVLLDFFLANTSLGGETGNVVRATINGNEFYVDTWIPYVMEGLVEGENTVKLELLDKNGEGIPGPFNVVTRTFTLEPEDAM